MSFFLCDPLYVSFLSSENYVYMYTKIARETVIPPL